MSNHLDHAATQQASKKILNAGIIATGTHLGTQLIHKVAARPLLVISLGIAAGILLQKKISANDHSDHCCGGEE